MTQYVQAKIERIEQPVTVWVFFAIGLLSMLAYAYFVNGAISNIVAAKETESRISELSSEVGELESRYLSAKSSLDLEYAAANGYKESGADIAYVAKKPLASLSFNR